MHNIQKGRDLRDSQLALFAVRDAEFLRRCRELAVLLAKQDGQVSINEVRSYLVPPDGVSPSVFGAVFKDRRFKAVGYTQATHPEAHARAIRVYALKEVGHGQ